MTTITAGQSAPIEERFWPDRPQVNRVAEVFSFQNLLADIDRHPGPSTVDLREPERERDRTAPVDLPHHREPEGRATIHREQTAQQEAEHGPERDRASARRNEEPYSSDRAKSGTHTTAESEREPALDRPDGSRPQPAADIRPNGSPGGKSSKASDKGDTADTGERLDMAAAPVPSQLAMPAHASEPHGAVQATPGKVGPDAQRPSTPSTPGQPQDAADARHMAQVGTPLAAALSNIKGNQPRINQGAGHGITPPAVSDGGEASAKLSGESAPNAEDVQAALRGGTNAVALLDRSLHSKPAATLVDGSSLRAILAAAQQGAPAASAADQATAGDAADSGDAKAASTFGEGRSFEASLLKSLQVKATAAKGTDGASQKTAGQAIGSALAATTEGQAATGDRPAPLGSALQAPAVGTGSGLAPAAQTLAAAATPAGSGRSTPVPGTAPDQVAVQISKAVGAGKDQVSIRLHPAELGRVDVRMEMSDDGHLRATITAERVETLELLQRDARSLERALQQAGLKTDSGSLSFSLRGDGGQQQGSDRDARAGSGRKGAPAVGEPDPATAGAASRPASLHDGAIDITV